MQLHWIRSESKNVLIIAALVLISMGSLLLAFELGGSTLAVVFHAICVGVAVRFFVSEPQRVRAKVRERTAVLQDLAYRDGLTGLPNRRFFDWYVETYLPRQVLQGRTSLRQESNRETSHGKISRIEQNRKMTSIVLFDLNGFKSVNDTYGHDAGDELLKHVSDSLISALPADVVLARLGGDEFVAIVHDIENGNKLTSVIKIIRKSSKSPIIYQRQRIQVSASVGVASTFRRRPVLGDLLRDADKEMYADKAIQREQRQQRETTPLRALLDAQVKLYS